MERQLGETKELLTQSNGAVQGQMAQLEQQLSDAVSEGQSLRAAKELVEQQLAQQTAAREDLVAQLQKQTEEAARLSQDAAELQTRLDGTAAAGEREKAALEEKLRAAEEAIAVLQGKLDDARN